MKTCIKSAVIPAAGLGTRLLPITKAIPKEMLAIGNRPIIHFIVEECLAAGIEHLVIVINDSKSAIKDYFDEDPGLALKLKQANKPELYNQLLSAKPLNLRIDFVNQIEAKGLGHAILQAKQLLEHQPFAVLLPDVLLKSNDSLGQPKTLRKMLERFTQTSASQILVEYVERSAVSNFGIVAINEVELAEKSTSPISRLVEKPSPEQAPSQYSIVGRYVLSDKIFECLQKTSPDANQEIQLTDAIAQLLNYEQVEAHRLDDSSYDCGSISGYIKAFQIFSDTQPA